jgi:TolB protein
MKNKLFTCPIHNLHYSPIKLPVATFFVFVMSIGAMNAQWSNRYPKVDGYGHHVYLEAFELPVYNPGPTEPAVMPDPDQLIFSAKGWLWKYHISERIAYRLTKGLANDSRARVSKDGKSVVFVRDTGTDTHIVLKNLEDNSEEILVDSPAMELDPVFGLDDKELYFSSASEGSFDIWKLSLVTGEKTRISTVGSLERLPQPLGGDKLIVLTKEDFSDDRVLCLDLNSGDYKELLSDNFTSQLSFDLSPDGELLVYTYPHDEFYQLNLIHVDRPDHPMLLTFSEGLPLNPRFSNDGRYIYYTEPDKDERQELKRISVYGGQSETLKVDQWVWGVPTTTIRLQTLMEGRPGVLRISLRDTEGHYYYPEKGLIHSEGQWGHTFFYSSGEDQITLPNGSYELLASRGFDGVPRRMEFTVGSGNSTEIVVDMKRIWDPEGSGWYAGDNHFHMNYGGSNLLSPTDLQREAKGEGLSIVYPLLANLHNRYIDKQWWQWGAQNPDPPYVRFGQEVRSHFLGHLNLIGTNALFQPWIWGPYYGIYGQEDITNAEALRFGREHGGLGGYVHPIDSRDPFLGDNKKNVPVEMVADCVLGEVDLLEVGCLWTDELGTAEFFHQLLNIGAGVNLSAGSDAMTDYFRTMALGASRVYVKTDGPFSPETYLQGLKEGRSFVSTGPLLEFQADNKEPGGIITTDQRKVPWTLQVHSISPYQQVEILVNGKVAWTKRGNYKGIRRFNGKVEVPDGGWISARVYGETASWPLLDSYPFAETSPIWFHGHGSYNKQIRSESAKKLLEVLNVSRGLLEQGYSGSEIPKLKAQFAKAEEKLRKLSED